MPVDQLTDIYRKKTLILGCGNVLFGDDGFGPETARHIEENYSIPEDTAVLDAGTGVRDILFDIALSEHKPARIVIIDAYDCGREPGELFSVTLEDVPASKTDDFSLHQVRTSNLLRELRDLARIDITIIAVQPQSIPDVIKPGLSVAVRRAIPECGEYLVQMGLVGRKAERP